MRHDHSTPDIPDYEPWDSGEYRNGSTRPPKNHGGLFAVLLIAIILLCGIVTVLSFMNIRLFQTMDKVPADNSLPSIYSTIGQEDSQLPNETVPMETAEQQKVVQSELSPPSVANIPQEGGLSLQEIYETVIPSVVSISCTSQQSSSTGTGVILSKEGYIVTNCHVVEQAGFIQVLLSDGRRFDAGLVGMDEISDLAVLHIAAEELTPAVLGDSSMLRVGDLVVAIGDPLGIELRGTMTDGIVSAINRDIELEGRTMNLIQTNAALNSGNSGGPLINCYGQVVGINTMKMTNSMNGGVEGLGFAIPSTTVEDIVNQLILQGFVSGRPELGIIGERISSFYQLYYHLPQGLYVTQVAEDSAAEKAGIEVGDILITIDGTPVTSSDALKTILYAYSPGDVVQAVIYRSGHQYHVPITMGEAKH